VALIANNIVKENRNYVPPVSIRDGIVSGEIKSNSLEYVSTKPKKPVNSYFRDMTTVSKL